MYTTLVHTDPEIYVVSVPFPNISTNATNCYIIRDGGESLVVDTGAPTDEGRRILCKALEELNVDIAGTPFFLTHFHLDHAGLVDSVLPPESPLYVSFLEYQRTRPEGRSERSETMFQRFLAVGASGEEAQAVRQVLLEDGGFVGEDHSFAFVGGGDLIQVGNYCFKVIDTAGHTAGHLSLYEPASGVCIGGDHLLFVISPSIDYFLSEQSNYEIYRANLEQLKSLPIELFLHSHGALRDDFYERIDWLIAHHEERLTKTLEIIEKSPNLLGIEVIKAIRWNVPVDTWEEISLLQRTVIIVQGLVLLDHLVKKGQVERIHDCEGKVRYRII